MQRSSRQKGGREGGREGHVPIPGGNHKAFYFSLCEKGAEVAHVLGLVVGEGGREGGREGGTRTQAHVLVSGGNHNAFYFSLCEKGAEVAHVLGLVVIDIGASYRERNGVCFAGEGTLVHLREGGREGGHYV